MSQKTRPVGLALALSLAMLFAAGCSKKRRVPSAPMMVKPGWTETGTASWYGNPYHGRRAANGEIYDMEKLTAAHRTLPFGTLVQVSNLANGKTVDVRITDRGPFVKERIIDLSRAAAREIAMLGPGTVRVRLLVTGTQQSVPVEVGHFAVQVGAFTEKPRAERLKKDLERRYSPVEILAREGQVTQWRVLVGRKSSQQEADALAGELRTVTGDAFVVRWDADDR